MYVNKYDLEGKLLCAFYTKEMCISTEHITSSELNNVLQGRRQHISGFRYKLFINRNTLNIKPLNQSNLKNKHVYTEDNIGIKYYGSIAECAKHFKVDPSTISKMLSGDRINKFNVKYTETK
jgi:hypothetical protein